MRKELALLAVAIFCVGTCAHAKSAMTGATENPAAPRSSDEVLLPEGTPINKDLGLPGEYTEAVQKFLHTVH